jgi:hypothetical protein
MEYIISQAILNNNPTVSLSSDQIQEIRQNIDYILSSKELITAKVIENTAADISGSIGHEFDIDWVEVLNYLILKFKFR